MVGAAPPSKAHRKSVAKISQQVVGVWVSRLFSFVGSLREDFFREIGPPSDRLGRARTTPRAWTLLLATPPFGPPSQVVPLD